MALSFSDIVLADPNCVAYWPLTSDGTDLKGGNTMLLTDVVFVDGAAYFNGTSSLGISTDVLDLSGTDKVTVIANIKLNTFPIASYSATVISHGLLATEVAVIIELIASGGSEGDEYLQIGANGVAVYNLGNHAIRQQLLNSKTFIALTHDKALTDPEHKGYVNGNFRTPNTYPFTENLTGNFASKNVYIAKSPALTGYANGYISEVAIFSRILTEPEIATLYLSLQENTTKQGIITKVMINSGYANYIGIAGKLHGYDLIGGTSLSSVIFKNGGSSGTTLWKDSVKLQAAIGDNTARIRFREPIIFSDDIYVTLAGTGAYVNIIYESLE